jgi:HD superfamily phosphohydrolase
MVNASFTARIDPTATFDLAALEHAVVAHPTFQRLGTVMQLGQIARFNPFAAHTRGFHSLRVHDIHVQELEWAAKNSPGILDDNEVRERSCFHALLHDLGHYAGSHATESVIVRKGGLNHKKNGWRVLQSGAKDSHGRTLLDIAADAGVDVAKLEGMFFGTDPVTQLCAHKTLGSDKLAYTYDDSVFTRFYQQPPKYTAVIPHVVFKDGKLGVAITGTRERTKAAERTDTIMLTRAQQLFIVSMYAGVFYSEQSMAHQRHLQKAVELALDTNEITIDTMAAIGDEELYTRLANASGPHGARIQALIAPLANKHRSYHPDVLMKLEPYAFAGNSLVQRSEPLDEDFVAAFSTIAANPLYLTRLEDLLTKQYNTEVLVSCVPDSSQFDAGDVHLFKDGAAVGTLNNRFRAHKEGLRELADRAYSIGIHPQDSSKAYRISDAEKVEYFVASTKKLLADIETEK